MHEDGEAGWSAMNLVTDWAAARLHMVEGQVRPNRVTDPRIIQAMLELPREALVPPASQALAYADALVPVAPGRALLPPMIVARLVQEAAPREGERALVLPGRAGYGALLLDRLGLGVTVLETPEFAAPARAALAAAGAALAVVAGRFDQGHAGGAPYDLILIEAAVASLPPALAAQLAAGGRIAAIMGADPPRQAVLAELVDGQLVPRPLFDAAALALEELQPLPAFSL